LALRKLARKQSLFFIDRLLNNMHFSIPSLCLLLSLFPTWALAQFGFFDQMFNAGHQGRPQQQQQASGVTQYQSRVDSVACNRYLCPTTLDCVDIPAMCPCPYAEDIKCVIPDIGPNGKPDKNGVGTVICTSGDPNACVGLQKLL